MSGRCFESVMSYTDGLMQDCGISIVIALETPQPCTISLIYRCMCSMATAIDRSVTYGRGSDSKQTPSHVYVITYNGFLWHASAHPCPNFHYNDVIMGSIVSQITNLTIVYSDVYSGADQRKHQSSASLAFVRGIRRGPVNSPHKGPVTRKMFPFDDVIMQWRLS